MLRWAPIYIFSGTIPQGLKSLGTKDSRLYKEFSDFSRDLKIELQVNLVFLSDNLLRPEFLIQLFVVGKKYGTCMHSRNWKVKSSPSVTQDRMKLSKAPHHLVLRQTTKNREYSPTQKLSGKSRGKGERLVNFKFNAEFAINWRRLYWQRFRWRDDLHN